ncbi:hypothetical protein SCB49_12724 [unidentified eubacterium SCB49]|nr:hypothetical protein SCB49_12724 [unidentified eubacterium SCB49]
MKKILALTVVIFSFALQAQAQEISKNAIGLRIGDNDGFGTEINYQRGLSDNNRLEFGLQLNGDNNVSVFKATGLYQWVWNIEGGFNWYAGAGAGLASVSFDDDRFPEGFDTDNELSLFVAGTVGIEYDFDFPILLSLDVRPELGFGDYRDDLGFDFALGIRYQFD